MARAKARTRTTAKTRARARTQPTGKPAPRKSRAGKSKVRSADLPRLAIIACSWHPLESIENATRDGFTYGPDTLVLPVRCTGAITVANILRLFARELEGVLILGCNEGDCHYFNGSERCAEIVNETREILEWSGIAPERLGFTLVSGSEGKNFVKALEAYLKEVKKAGPKRRKRVA
jgi:F420-non-reducing hydrogenase iron-sulfur subunit